MKKVLFMLMMVLATMGMASCGGGNNNADDPTKELAEQLEAGDVNKFQSALEAIKTKATTLLAENPEQAKELIGKVQEFISANKEKVTQLVGGNETVSNLVNTITAANPEQVVSTLAGALGTQVEQGQEAVQQQAEDLIEGAQQQAEDLIEGAQQQAEDLIEGAQQQGEELLENVQDQLGL